MTDYGSGVNSRSVTVLIAAYNAEAFIERAVKSALNQTYAPLEVLVVDDCSTDNTLSVLEFLAKQDDRIRILRQEQNEGPSVVRNRGIADARGDYVAVLDADDAFEPQRLECIMKIADDADIISDDFAYYNPATDTVGSPANAFADTVTTLGIHEFIERARPFQKAPDLGLLKPIFRRKYLLDRDIGYPEHIRHGEDFHLIAELLLSGAKYLVSNNVGYLYTPRSSGWSRTKINYSRMIKESQKLLLDARVANDKRLASLVSKRVAALRKYAAEYLVRTLWDERKFVALIAAMMTNRQVVAAVGRFAKRKVFHASAK